MKINKNQFDSYEEVRKSGQTNMFMISNVCALSGLEKDEVMEIIERYDELSEEFKK